MFVDTTQQLENWLINMAIKAPVLIKKLIELGQMATINDDLDVETATLIAEDSIMKL